MQAKIACGLCCSDLFSACDRFGVGFLSQATCCFERADFMDCDAVISSVQYEQWFHAEKNASGTGHATTTAFARLVSVCEHVVEFFFDGARCQKMLFCPGSCPRVGQSAHHQSMILNLDCCEVCVLCSDFSSTILFVCFAFAL